MCGAATCRGFIGKRTALLSTSKPVVTKGNLSRSKIKHVVKGRITKTRATEAIKTHGQKGKRNKAKNTVAKPKKRITKPGSGKSSIKPKTPSGSKEKSVLGKRKREDSVSRSETSSPTKKRKGSELKIVKPRERLGRKEKVNTPKPHSGRRIYDIVSRPRRKNVG